MGGGIGGGLGSRMAVLVLEGDSTRPLPSGGEPLWARWSGDSIFGPIGQLILRQ